MMKISDKNIRVASPTIHYLVAWVMLSFIVVVIMSVVFRIEIVARGQGKVVPVSRVQVVQPEYPGQIKNIFIDNGDLVEKKQLLIQLDITDIQAEINKVRLELDHLQVEALRIDNVLKLLMVYQSGIEQKQIDAFVEFRPGNKVLDKGYFNDQQLLFKAEMTEFRDMLKQFSERIQTNTSSGTVVKSEIRRVKSALVAQQKRLAVADNLLPQGVLSESDHLDVVEKFDSLKIESEINYLKLEQINKQEDNIVAERKSYLSSQLRTYYERRSEIESSTSLLTQNLNQNQYIKRSKSLRSPVDGYVDQLKVFTIGGVAQAGEELLRIVPSGNHIVIDAVFTNTDIGFLEIGQKANIRLDAFPSERFGFVEGVVIYVSADAKEITAKEWGFEVRIELDTPYLKTPTENYTLKPGMTATTDVITGDRKIISYFFAPILKTIQDSMGER